MIMASHHINLVPLLLLFSRVAVADLGGVPWASNWNPSFEGFPSFLSLRKLDVRGQADLRRVSEVYSHRPTACPTLLRALPVQICKDPMRAIPDPFRFSALRCFAAARPTLSALAAPSLA